MNKVRAGEVRPVILCGGSGTRLWPASRESNPKQFAAILGERSTFQMTLERVNEQALFGKPLVVTNRAHRFLAEQQMREVGIEADILLEPTGRDSGPAIAAASLYLEERSPECLALVLAADHLVRDVPAFRASVRVGVEAARAGRIVTFGVVPTHPATGYGYLAPGASVEGGANALNRFVEKPDVRTALDYIAKGYLWNAGNFLFAPASVIAEYARQDGTSLDWIRTALAKGETDLGALAMEAEAFSAARRISFDYAVMENAERAAVVPGNFDWSDIGGWDALWDLSDKDEAGNGARGRAVFVEARDNYASSEGALVTLLGVENLVVVATRDAVMVADRTKGGAVKGLVETLKAKGEPEATSSARVYRPWGWYQTLDHGKRFQVKRIVVYPGGRLSLQKHFHRAEHWVVVKGTARITLEADVREMTENESIYIPLGAMHRLENPGRIDVEIIEVQTGSYLGEDDIVRLEDDYSRA